MPNRTRRRLGVVAAALLLTYVAGGQLARFDVDTRLGTTDQPLARATVELGVAGVSVLISYTTGLTN